MAKKKNNQETGKAAPEEAGVLRTFHVLGLERESGRVVLAVNGKPVYAVDVKQGEATLTTANGDPARVMTSLDSEETLEDLLQGRKHPIVLGLQNLIRNTTGDRRFGLSVLLALRASAPAFAEGRI